MKFTDGNWMLQKGVQAYFAAEAYEVNLSSNSISIVAPCHPIRHRGDTLSGPNLTVTLSSPLEDVIRVKVEHYQGTVDHGPHFAINDSAPDVSIAKDEQSISIQSGKLSAVIPASGGWKIDFVAEGKVITSSPSRGTAYMQVNDREFFMRDQLLLGVGETVYGLGERFTPLVKNGQTVEIWNRDGGTNSDQAYKNIPFYLTNRGYGVFVNHPGNVSYEIGTERTNIAQFSVAGEEMEYMVIYGPTPKEILQKYTALTGRPALPPLWSFGLWLSTSFTTNYDEATVTEFIQGMKDRDIPLGVFHYDCFWMKGFHWCDFEWDPDVFPDPEGMLGRLHDRGLRVCVWINSYIGQASKLFKEGKEKGYFLKRPNGDVWQTDLWQPGMAIVDFTNPEAKSWFQSHIVRLAKMGVDAIKTDFGERIPTDVVYFDASDPERMHNYYTQIYNQAVWEALESVKGKGEAVLFARSATTGGQLYPVHWGGDCWSTFEAMAESLRGGLSLGMSGFGFWSHDIGGFEGFPPPEIYKRWVAFGLLSSHSRLHASTSYRVPWLFDEESVDVLRMFTKLKHRLMPYLWAKAIEAHETGIPVMRSMLLEFPDDPACTYLDQQFMLGDSLLVAPVFTVNGSVEYYLPAGKWRKVLTGEFVDGGRWMKEVHSPLSIPLLQRENSVLVMSRNESSPEYKLGDGFDVQAFGDSGFAKVYDPETGTEYEFGLANGAVLSEMGSELYSVKLD